MQAMSYRQLKGYANYSQHWHQNKCKDEVYQLWHSPTSLRRIITSYFQKLADCHNNQQQANGPVSKDKNIPWHGNQPLTQTMVPIVSQDKDNEAPAHRGTPSHQHNLQQWATHIVNSIVKTDITHRKQCILANAVLQQSKIYQPLQSIPMHMCNTIIDEGACIQELGRLAQGIRNVNGTDTTRFIQKARL